jgi:FKBP-type peptidyl-prolyl cis-trans isomerase SlyD
MNETAKVEDGQVILMEYTLKVDDVVLDSSKDNGPIEFIQGAGNIIQGLERELYGMTIGESKEVRVSAQDGYGDIDHEAFSDVPRDQFPDNIPMEVGTQLELHDQTGKPVHARIDKVEDTSVRLDFNHPLAGKELFFAIKIAGLREPTEEEREHGHAHSQGHGNEH